ncbi:MAG: hypothetical protein QNJ72_07695 [Pleurocapsa sp. MO_226.B13]|nr:hypothetical protein [Pleurocapsa sp. MO_226.B13]
MKLEITVTKEDLYQAVENLIYDQLDEDTFSNDEAIAIIIKQHIESQIEDIISNPENHLNSDELSRVNQNVYLSDNAYKKMMDRDIPYPA